MPQGHTGNNNSFTRHSQALQSLFTGLVSAVSHSRLTSTRQGLVDGADVDARGRSLAVGNRHQPEDGHFCVELLWPRLSDQPSLGVPAGSLQEKAMDEAARLWPRYQFFRRFLHHLENMAI